MFPLLHSVLPKPPINLVISVVEVTIKLFYGVDLCLSCISDALAQKLHRPLIKKNQTVLKRKAKVVSKGLDLLSHHLAGHWRLNVAICLAHALNATACPDGVGQDRLGGGEGPAQSCVQNN